MPNANWNPVLRLQHWLTVLLMLGCLIAVWSHEAFDKSDPLRVQLMQFHFLAGGAIGLLTLSRLLTRALTRAPEQAMTPLLARLAHLGHAGLYLLMLLLPVCGYVAASGKGVPVSLLGLLELPPMPVDKHVAKLFKEVHEGLGNGLIGLVALHIGAVLFHAVVLRDQVLPAMLGRARR